MDSISSYYDRLDAVKKLKITNPLWMNTAQWCVCTLKDTAWAWTRVGENEASDQPALVLTKAGNSWKVTGVIRREDLPAKKP